ncbi:hypothetical protein HG531_010895 [Fusarium graminearum]|nr:hypothetical protein HG531_010895 [Fusarium graminearum]
MPSAQTPASQETSGSLLSGLGSLAQLLEFLLADNLGCAIGVELDIASLVLALELLDRDTGLLSKTLVVGLGKLLGLGGSGSIVAVVIASILHLLINLLDELLGLLNLLGGGSFVGLLVGNTISVAVVSAGLLDSELTSTNDLTRGGNVGTLRQERLALELAEVVLELDAVAETEDGALLLIGIILNIAKSIDTETESSLSRQHTGDLSLVSAGSLADKRRVVDETVLGCVVLGLESTEKSLLGTENLDGGTRGLGQADERSSVGDEASTNEVTDKSSQVGSDGTHAALEVRRELGSVVGVNDDLVSQELDVLKILLSNLGTHADLSSSLQGDLNLLGKDLRKVAVGNVGAHANSENDASVGQVVVKNLGHLGEVPSVPLLGSHGVNVELLVEVVKELDSLDDHGVDLIGRELELVARHGVRKTQSHAVKVLLKQAGDEVGHLASNASEKIHSVGARDRGDVKIGQVGNSCAKLHVGNSDRSLLLGLEVVEELGEKLGDLALLERGSLFESGSGTVELDKLLELEPVRQDGVSCAYWRKFSQMKNVQNLHFDDLFGSAKLSSEFLVLEHLLVGSLEQAIAASC